MYLGGWAFAALVLVATAICMHEFMSMSVPTDRLAQLVFTVLGTSVCFLAISGVFDSIAGTVVVAFLPIVTTCFYLFRIGDITTVAARAGLTMLGIVWGGGLFSTACLRFLEHGTSWVLLACILSWVSDTGAYFAGRWFGRHKLYETVSPKKTWEGAIGGVVAATAGAFALVMLTGAPEIPPQHLIVLAPIAAALGQVGDLAESLLKRSVGVKDSGRIMPGHGGLFDRVDALIFVGATLLAYALVVLGATPAWLTLPW
jgi:phosphatidate cytidylyltransferase